MLFPNVKTYSTHVLTNYFLQMLLGYLSLTLRNRITTGLHTQLKPRSKEQLNSNMGERPQISNIIENSKEGLILKGSQRFSIGRLLVASFSHCGV